MPEDRIGRREPTRLRRVRTQARPLGGAGRCAVASLEQERALRRLERLARLLDGAIRIPGLGLRVGLDALVGLVPVVGDLAGAALSGHLVRQALRLGASRRTVARMLANVALESAVGMVPLLGDAFDAVFRANERNVRLLREDLRGRRRTRAAP